MQPAVVLGSARATVKHSSLNGERLLVLQPLGTDDASDGPPLLAVDHLGARKGDRVMITSDGTHAREMLNDDHTPVRWSVFGLIDATSSLE